MAKKNVSSEPRSVAKDLLLQDHRYLSESFWNNEKTGETRLSLFISIVTLVIGAVVNLGTKGDDLGGEAFCLILLAAFSSLLVLGVITMLRMLTRNENADKYKHGMDSIRQIFLDRFDGEQVLIGYNPHGVPGIPKKDKPRKKERLEFRKIGGLAYTSAAINALLLAGIVGAAVYWIALHSPAAVVVVGEIILWVVVAFLAGALAQFVYIFNRDRISKEKLKAGDHTHARGVVYRRFAGRRIKYLLVKSREDDAWIFPGGHIEQMEGHADAAIREIAEETGFVVRREEFLGSFACKRSDGKVDRTKFYLLEHLYPPETPGEREKGWFSCKEALSMLKYEESKFVLQEADKKLAGK